MIRSSASGRGNPCSRVSAAAAACHASASGRVVVHSSRLLTRHAHHCTRSELTGCYTRTREVVSDSTVGRHVKLITHRSRAEKRVPAIHSALCPGALARLHYQHDTVNRKYPSRACREIRARRTVCLPCSVGTPIIDPCTPLPWLSSPACPNVRTCTSWAAKRYNMKNLQVWCVPRVLRLMP
jgi:hypothetical protein